MEVNCMSEENKCKMEISGTSIDTKELSTRKVIELKIDNAFLSNGDTENEVADSNDPFCIKPSKGVGNGRESSRVENGEDSTVDKDPDGKGNEDKGNGSCILETADSHPMETNDIDNSEAITSQDRSKGETEASSDLDDQTKTPNAQPLSSNESSMDSEILKDGSDAKDNPAQECSTNSDITDDISMVDKSKDGTSDGQENAEKCNNNDKQGDDSERQEHDVITEQSESERKSDPLVSNSDSNSMPSGDSNQCKVSDEYLVSPSDNQTSGVPEPLSDKALPSDKETDTLSVGQNDSKESITDEKEGQCDKSGKTTEKINLSENFEKSSQDFSESSCQGKTDVVGVENGDSEISKKDSTQTSEESNENNSARPTDATEVHPDDADGKGNKDTKEKKLDDANAKENRDMSQKHSDEVESIENKDISKKRSDNVVNTESKERPVGKSEKEDEKSVGKSVEKVTDIDGSEILITINEVESDKEEEHSEGGTDKTAKNAVVDTKPKEQERPSSKVNKPTENVKKPESSKMEKQETCQNEHKVKSVFENDVVIVDLSGSPKEKEKPAFPVIKPSEPKGVLQYYLPSQAQGVYVQKAPYTLSAAASAPYLHVSGSNTTVSNSQGNPQYIQRVIIGSDGKKQYVNMPISSQTSGSRSLYSNMLTQAANTAKQNQQSLVSPASTAQKPAPAQNSSAKKEDDDIPAASWEQIDLIRYEIMTKKFDNTFWAGQCPVNKKAPLSEPTKFLFDLGSDLVKQSAYEQITHVQGKKNEAGKLGEVEKENLEKMKKVVEELKQKLKHLQLKVKKCDGCNFMTESENVMRFHKEHPHMKPQLDPFGDLHCSMKDCEFSTRNVEAFAFHMEAEHRMKARVYDKPDFFQCSLCYFESKTKNQLTKHKFKCAKQHKPNFNLCPHYPDVNYCLKNIFYKYQIKKPPPPKAPPQPPKQIPPKPPKPAERYRPPIIKPKAGPVVQSMPYVASPRNILVTTPQSATVGAPQRQLILQNQQFPKLSTASTVGSPMPAGVQIINRAPVKPGQKPTVSELLKYNKSPTTAQNQKEPLPQHQQQHNVPQNIAPKPAKSGFEVCEICGGYVKDIMSLRIHFYYAHKVDLPVAVFNRNLPPLICDMCKARFWTTQGLYKHKQSLRHYPPQTKPQTQVKMPTQVKTPTQNNRVMKCWICSRQPDNLYSHLHKFHRLSTSECMALRRCMFCGIQSNTRKDLEIHMASAHGVLIKGEQQPAKPTPSATTTGSGMVRNNFCVFCTKQFPDNTHLTLHCLRDHATCSGCGMVVSKAADLATHVCKVSSTRKCPICGVRNLKAQYLTKHLQSHMKKCSVKLKRLTDQDIENGMGKKRKLEMDMEKQKEVFTKLEADIWSEIENRRKRDQEEEESKKDPVAHKRKMEDDEEEKIQQKLQKLEEKDEDFKPASSVEVSDK